MVLRRSARRSSARPPRPRGTRPRATSASRAGSRSLPTRTSSTSTATRQPDARTSGGTGAEIVEASAAGASTTAMTAGTGGTITGVARPQAGRARREGRRRRPGGLDPRGPRAHPQLQGRGASAATSSPDVLDRSRSSTVGEERGPTVVPGGAAADSAGGLLCGSSAGAAVWAARCEIAKREPGKADRGDPGRLGAQPPRNPRRPLDAEKRFHREELGGGHGRRPAAHAPRRAGGDGGNSGHRRGVRGSA